MDRLTLIVAILAGLGLAGMLWQFRIFSAAIRTRGLGRIFYISLVALVAWVVLVMAYFLFNSFYPHALGPVGDNQRESVRLSFGVYLLVLVTAANVAIWRWRKEA